MTTTVAERTEQAQAPTAPATSTSASATRPAAAPQAEANLLTFIVAMIAMTIAVVTMAAVGAVTGTPVMLFASAALGLATTGVGIHTGINLMAR